MDQILLDTDVFSLFFRRDTRSLLYDDDVRDKIRCLSFASVAELRFGAIVAGWQERRRRQLETAIGRTVILPGDNDVVERWAQVKAARQKIGRPIASEDCWIAATALRHNITLATHNAKDYQHIPDLKIASHAETGR